MKRIFKLIKRTFLLSIGILIITITLFMSLSPQFGGKHSTEDIKRYDSSGHYEEGKFKNLIPTPQDMSFGNIVGMLKDFIVGVPRRSPEALEKGLLYQHFDR